MTTIGPLTIEVLETTAMANGIDWNITLAATTEAKYQQFRELFGGAPGNTGFKKSLGGLRKFVDQTENHDNVQWCEFDSGHRPLSGYYLLRRMSEPRKGKWDYILFTIQISFIGTLTNMANGFYVESVETVTNDWDI